MSSLQRIRSGGIAKAFGTSFENLILSTASRDDLVILKIPDGCATKKARTPSGFRNHLIRVRTPFDFCAFHRGMGIVFDAKTIEQSTFPRSATTPHQLMSLKNCSRHTVASGHVVWHRDKDLVIWYSITQLLDLHRGESLKPEDGLPLGRGGSLCLLKVFESV